MSFQEVVGQEAAIAQLKKAFINNRTSHAYCFAGPEGVGKKKAAFNFAKLLMCAHAKNAEPCDSCPACVKVSAMNHPDVFVVAPEGQFIKIDSIREACRRLNLKGFESTKKILIISEAQSLNEESSNALLKTLEEPSADTVIILLADTLKSILPTIRSRCQRVIFQAFPESMLKKMLETQFKLSAEEAAYLVRISMGRLGVALKYHEARLFERKNKMLEDVLTPGFPLDKLFSAGSLERSEKNLKMDEILCVLSSWFRDLMLAKTEGHFKNFINVDRKDDIMVTSRRYTFSEIEGRISAIADTAFENERNINWRISMANLRMELWK